ncbi:MAG: universal stress protein [Acidobacteriia bacterium]|nr:universal stress protein [Terriglobia bacterium]
MRILIALDATPSAAIVLQEAVARPWPAGSSFSLLTVVDPYGFAKAPLLLEKAKAAARDQLQSAAERLEGTGWKSNTDVILGNPRRAISGYAAGWEADLLMVGSHGHGNMARLILGSTARAALRRAPCSVEIVRMRAKEGDGGKDGKMKILVATDGSQFSAAALRSVASRPWPKGSEVKVLAVPELVLPLKEFPYFDAAEIEEVNKSEMELARASVAKGEEILSGRGLKVSTEVPVLWEMPSQAILNEAERWQARMIVLGSHGKGGFDRLTMGSVSETVALHAGCSVEVIREHSLQSES